MKEFKYVIKDAEGIHARPAGELVKAAKEFTCSITITKDGKSGDCRKIFGLMGLGVKQEMKLYLLLMVQMKKRLMKQSAGLYRRNYNRIIFPVKG